MPDSPGFRIGVPVSTPNTPTLVIVIVPPAMSAGVVLPARAVSVSVADRVGQLAQRQLVGVLDVRHDQPAVGGRGDAQIDVVLQDDLAGRFVPAGVDLRGSPSGEDDGLGHEQQRRDLDVAELAPGGDPVAQLHRRGHVDGQELGDVRGGERRGHHRRGRVLTHAL